ncbi:MAG: CoA transferase [Dehalococcoidia bacterium]|nr:CoA transferase [Dehalococcoidia bacterium]
MIGRAHWRRWDWGTSSFGRSTRGSSTQRSAGSATTRRSRGAALSGRPHTQRPVGSGCSSRHRAATSPFAPGVTVADIATGMNACTAVLAALYDRDRTGEGQAINVTLMDSQLAFLAEAAAPALVDPEGTSWTPFRHGLQRTRDGYVAINAGSPRNWRRLARATGQAESDASTRESAERMLEEWAAGTASTEVARAMEEVGAPYGVLRTIREAVQHPYFAERGMIASIPDPLEGTARVVSSPLYFSNADSGPMRGAPLAGEHTVEILRELGLSDDEVSEMERDGVIERTNAAGEASK